MRCRPPGNAPRCTNSISGALRIRSRTSNPPESIADPARRAAHEELAARVAAAGEVFRSHFDTDALHEKLRSLGFREIEDLGPAGMAARYFPDRPSSASGGGGHILRASPL